MPGPPFEDDFESGFLDPLKWTVETTVDGRAQVSGEYPASGSFSLLLDDAVNDSNDSIAAVVSAPFDLSSIPNPILSFEWRDFRDENDPEDGVFLSLDGGLSWSRILSFNEGPSEYTREELDLSADA